jgi:hypothetical protein
MPGGHPRIPPWAGKIFNLISSPLTGEDFVVSSVERLSGGGHWGSPSPLPSPLPSSRRAGLLAGRRQGRGSNETGRKIVFATLPEFLSSP